MHQWGTKSEQCLPRSSSLVSGTVIKDQYAMATEAEAAAIAKAVEKADILNTRIRDRVTNSSDFIGRAWLAKLLVSSLDSLSPQKAILITGVGGTGKSRYLCTTCCGQALARVGKICGGVGCTGAFGRLSGRI